MTDPFTTDDETYTHDDTTQDYTTSALDDANYQDGTDMLAGDTSGNDVQDLIDQVLADTSTDIGDTDSYDGGAQVYYNSTTGDYFTVDPITGDPLAVDPSTVTDTSTVTDASVLGPDYDTSGGGLDTGGTGGDGYDTDTDTETDIGGDSYSYGSDS